MAGFVAVHSGAGNSVNDSKYKDVCKTACTTATRIIENGGSALDACEAAIMCLENNSNTNAGFGSNLTWNGMIECDASIMDGGNLHFGACTNTTNIKNPIRLARELCDRQSKQLALGRIPPMVLSGTGASDFAKEIGLTIVDSSSLVSRKAAKCYHHYRQNVETYESINNIKLSPLDTVGAVCVDSLGHIVAGCSSGGIILKTPGRIGQAATYGAGCWAITRPNRSAGTCTTGNGEYLMKTLLAKEIVDDLIICDCPIISLHNTFKTKLLESPYLPQLNEVYGGALSIKYCSETGEGDVLWSHTTKAMCLAYSSTKQKSPKFIVSMLPTNCKPGINTVVSGCNFILPI